MLPSLYCFLVLAAFAAQAPPPIENKYPKGMPAMLAGFEDEARFIVIVADDRIGTMTSSWKKDGNYTATTELMVAGQKITRSTVINPDADGRWKEIRLTLPTGALTLKRDGMSATREYQGKASTFETRENVTLQDICSMASFAHSLRRYDRVQGGEQKFPVLVIGGGGIEVTLALEERKLRTVSGRDVDVLRWKYSVPGGAALVGGQGRDDRGVVCRLGAMVGGLGASATPGDHHSERRTSRGLLQHSVRIWRILPLGSHLVGRGARIERDRRCLRRRNEPDLDQEIRAAPAFAPRG
jgi:hypothetical protein